MTGPADRSTESMQHLAEMLGAQNAKKGGKSIYWKRPTTRTDGSRDPSAGWVFVASDENDRLGERFRLGWTPLPKYGYVRYGTDWDKNEWYALLTHPHGPKELPVDQVLTFGWYDPDKCERDTGVRARFPQLKGQTISVFACPECNDIRYLDPRHLARHLRNAHNYDPKQIFDWGQLMGIDFREELKGGGVRVFKYGEDEDPDEAPAPVPDDPDLTISMVTAPVMQTAPAPKALTAKQMAARQAASDRMKARHAATRKEKAAA